MKVKQLIKKLSELDPEANVYIGEGPGMTVRPVKYAHYGIYFKKDRIFLLGKWFTIPGGVYNDKVYIGKLLDRNRMDDAEPKDVLLSSWNGEFGDD